MKAGVAAALVAARDAAGRGLAGDVVVAAVADEEHASLGVQEAVAAVGADAAIVTEPTELELLVAHKGFVWSEIAVTGRAAHGSRPHLGVDAIVKMGPVLTALGELDDALAAREHPLLGRGSVHASVIEGGVELSSIPAACTLGVERRTLPGETADGVDAELGALLDRCRAADPALEVEQRTLLVREPFEVDPEAEIASARPRRRGGRARRAARDRRRLVLGRLRVHRRRGHPDGPLRPARRGRARRRGVGEPVEHRGRRPRAHRGRRAVLRVSRAGQPRRRPRGRAAARARRRRLPPRARRLRADAGARARRDRRRARPRRGAAQGRVRPARAAGVQGARRVLGGRARAARAAGRAHARHGERGQPRPRRRPRRRPPRTALPRLPPRGARSPSGARRSPARAPRSWSSTATTRRRSRARPPPGRGAGRARDRRRRPAGRPARVGHRRLRDALRRGGGAGGLRRDRRPGRRRLARRGGRAPRRGARRARDRRRAGRGRVPHGVARGRRADDASPTPGTTMAGLDCAEVSAGGVALAARRDRRGAHGHRRGVRGGDGRARRARAHDRRVRRRPAGRAAPADRAGPGAAVRAAAGLGAGPPGAPDRDRGPAPGG